MRGEFDLSLPHPHDLLYHARAARNRRHPHDQPQRKAQPTEALKYYRRAADHYHLDIRQYERVDSIAGEDNAFQVFTTDRLGRRHVYRARKIVLATGYYDVPNTLDVPGEELDKVCHYYKEAASRTTTMTWR